MNLWTNMSRRKYLPTMASHALLAEIWILIWRENVYPFACQLRIRSICLFGITGRGATFRHSLFEKGFNIPFFVNYLDEKYSSKESFTEVWYGFLCSNSLLRIKRTLTAVHSYWSCCTLLSHLTRCNPRLLVLIGFDANTIFEKLLSGSLAKCPAQRTLSAFATVNT